MPVAPKCVDITSRKMPPTCTPRQQRPNTACPSDMTTAAVREKWWNTTTPELGILTPVSTLAGFWEESNRGEQLDIIHDRRTLKPIVYWKLCSRGLTNASESDTNNMKSTWPMREFCVGDSTPPIFHLLALGVGLGSNSNFSVCVEGNPNVNVFRDQHDGIPNVKLWQWGSKAMRGPNENGFASQ